MIRTKVKVRDIHGLHLTPSAKVVRCAQKYSSRITLCHNCKEADACSILQILTLGARYGADIEISAAGPDEQEAVRNLEELFQDGSGI